jgi:hypothetical protein
LTKIIEIFTLKTEAVKAFIKTQEIKLSFLLTTGWILKGQKVRERINISLGSRLKTPEAKGGGKHEGMGMGGDKSRSSRK